MSKVRGQSLSRSLKRYNIDVNGNRTKVSSTKITKSGIDLPGTERKNYYKTFTEEEKAVKREKKLKREAKKLNKNE